MPAAMPMAGCRGRVEAAEGQKETVQDVREKKEAAVIWRLVIYGVPILAVACWIFIRWTRREQ